MFFTEAFRILRCNVITVRKSGNLLLMVLTKPVTGHSDRRRFRYKPWETHTFSPKPQRNNQVNLEDYPEFDYTDELEVTDDEAEDTQIDEHCFKPKPLTLADFTKTAKQKTQ